jgi:heptosyltransferase III
VNNQIKTKVLVVKRDKVGDLLLATPLFAAIKASIPHAELHVLANDYNAWVVARNSHIDKLWIYPRLRHGGALRPWAWWPTWRMQRALRAQAFDLAIAGGGVGSPRALSRVLDTDARVTVGYIDATPQCQALGARLTHALKWEDGIHEVDLNMAMLRAAGYAVPEPVPMPQYHIAPEDLAQGRMWLSAHAIRPGQFVILGINSRQAKRKPSLKQVRAWAAWLHEEHGLKTVFVYQAGADNDPHYPGDDALVAELAQSGEAYLHPLRNIDGDFLPFGIMWHARTSVFPDGGMAHFGAASPGGVLTLFADVAVSPPPAQWGPRGHNVLQLEAPRLVSELPDRIVFDALETLIARGYSGDGLSD